MPPCWSYLLFLPYKEYYHRMVYMLILLMFSILFPDTLMICFNFYTFHFEQIGLLFMINEITSIFMFITKTCPCNIQQFFTTVKNDNFQMIYFTFFKFLLKTLIMNTR